MPLRRRQSILIAVSTALGLLLVAGVFAWQGIRRLEEQLARGQRTQEVLTRLADFLSAVTDAETGVRGFAAAGEERFLEPYLNSRARAEEEIRELRRNLAGTAVPGERLQALDALLAVRYAELDRLIHVGRSEGRAAAGALVATGAGKEIHDQIRAGVQSIRREVEEDLERRGREARRATLAARLLIGLFSAAATLLALLGLTLSRRDHAAREQAEALARRALQRAEERVEQGTRELRESEARLRLALESARLGTFDWDIGAQRIVWSRAHEELWGFGPGEFDGKYETFSQRVHPDDLAVIGAELQRCLASRERFAGEYRVVWPDGSIHWVAGLGEFEFNEGGEAVRMRGVVMEITERKQAEESMRTTLESIGDGFLACDGEWRFVYVNNPAEQLLGASREALLGRVIWEAFPGAVGSLLEREYRAAAGGEARDFENCYAPWDRWFRNRAFPRRGGGVTVWFQDITEAKRAGAALAASEARAHLAMESARAGTWEWDLTTNRNHWSEELWKLYGLSPGAQEPSFEAWRASVHPEDLPAVEKSLEESVREGRELTLEWRMHPDRGPERWLLSRGRPLRDGSGRVVRYLGIVLDLTERRQLEATLRQRNEELVRFIYTVSHDLKSPLVTVRTFLGYLERDLEAGDRERVAKDVGFMRRAAEKMSDLLEDLLQLSRVGRKANPPEEIALQPLVQDALDLLAGPIQARGVVVKVTEEPLVLRGDRLRLREVFQNLIDNAVKFSGDAPEPRIEVGAEETGTGWVLFVRDHGLGIDARYHGKLFGLFEKLHPDTPGTGIGLALVKRIVEVHGGRIWAESDGPGRGATFRFTLAHTRRA